MDINLLPTGTRCFIDSNIFIYYLAGVSANCKLFLERVVKGEIEAHLTTIVVAEILHRRMIGEAVAKGVVTPSKALSKLKANPVLLQGLVDYVVEIRKLLRLPLNLIEVKQSDITLSHTLRQTHGLFVNDSINLACAERQGLSNIITHDTDFGRIASVTVWGPTDV